jgi:hypothetical protein
MEIETQIKMERGVIANIPSNCTFHYSQVDLAALEARTSDANMILELLVILAHSIAQKHEKVYALFTIREATVGPVALKSYDLNFHMPSTVQADLKDLMRLKKVNPFRVVKVRGPFNDGSDLAIFITVDSNDNPFDRVAYCSSHLHIESLGYREDYIFTDDTDDKRGATKRLRRTSNGR